MLSGRWYQLNFFLKYLSFKLENGPVIQDYGYGSRRPITVVTDPPDAGSRTTVKNYSFFI